MQTDPISRLMKWNSKVNPLCFSVKEAIWKRLTKEQEVDVSWCQDPAVLRNLVLGLSQAWHVLIFPAFALYDSLNIYRLSFLLLWDKQECYQTSILQNCTSHFTGYKLWAHSFLGPGEKIWIVSKKCIQLLFPLKQNWLRYLKILSKKRKKKVV